ncbi:amino acid ABC transporter permease [Roseicyclus sp. F158]|uniref:Amino acid ABC transporter permease n=1 Tax=Tropicimonas omnivorans TaxID=3075590 RepID=A0ABU3DF02_9RHOB|nr:amino acid ABC transporter permease [Roseicyclus sp. F158]MDT0682284.1 amino acid ABC transporter permease [Roseicyclus sp. F158]
MSDLHAQTVPYVRESMVPQGEPPATERGAVKWMRENLFSSWFNAILTIIGLAFVAWVLMHIVPWFWNSIWFAGSLTACREIRDATWGAGAPSACFSVITDRWQQLLLGFYPSELYWRPITALVLFGVAVAPVLFTRVPRQLLWFSAIYPVAMVWLLWGGTIWPYLLVLAGFALGVPAYRIGAKAVAPLLGVVAAIAVPILFWVFVLPPLSGALSSALPIGLEAVPSRAMGGFMLSFIIGVSGIALSLPLGILLALGRQSHLIFIHAVSVAFIELMRGVPLIVWLFTASLLLNYFLPPGTTFDLTLRVVIMVTFFASAYMAEVIRGGLAALPRGQYEAADSLGLDYWKAMRLIILPQALKISIPGIVNTFIGLFKDTTLVVFIGLLDPIGLSNAIRATTDWNGIYWELFIFIGALFFICCFAMSRYSMYLEQKLRTDHR